MKLVDVVAENFTPGTMERLGLDYQVLRQHNPGVIYAALPCPTAVLLNY